MAGRGWGGGGETRRGPAHPWPPPLVGVNQGQAGRRLSLHSIFPSLRNLDEQELKLAAALGQGKKSTTPVLSGCQEARAPTRGQQELSSPQFQLVQAPC